MVLTILLAILLGLAGLAAASLGVVLATSRRRPHDLLGALLAAGGLATAMLAAARILAQAGPR